MSGFPPPPNQRFAPPPGGGRGFAPPPPGQGFAAPPPPGQQRQQQPPQPPMQHLNQAMGNMSMQQPPPPPGASQPGRGFGAPQQMSTPQPPKPGAGFGPPPPGGGGFAPPPPGAAQQVAAAQPGTPGSHSSRPTFHPPMGGAAPPGAPNMMAPPAAPMNNNIQNPNAASSPFYQQTPTKPQMERVVSAQPGAPAAATGAMPQAGPMTNENIDYSVVIPERIMRWTASKLPQTATMANTTKIPFGAVLRPLAPMQDEEVDTVQPGTAGIVRCKRCRTYMNAFVTWSEHGRRWRCNICSQVNDCPSAYFCHLDERGLRRDRYERPELSKAVVEYIAPAEYMVRPPQEPTYFFVLDVSATAVRSGMLASASRAIKASLDDLPGRGRTKIGFITFDNGVHYFNLSSELSSPQMLVVSDLKELFVPLPDNLLVNLKESRPVVEAFLDSLPEMFAKNPVVSQSCLGPALKAAFTVMKQIGGKMSVFQSILPNLGDGALKPREQPGIMGTPNEVKLLKPDITWYKDTAVEFSRQQISVDMYLFPYQYMDLASLGELATYTAGSLHSYVNFSENKDGPRFEAQLNKALTEPTAFEAVMRIRCTKGMRITNFYGNFYIRGTDLLALPNCNSDAVFGFDLTHDEQNVTSSHVTVQAALLYTSSDGERRIRVMTQALPVSSLTSEVIASVDTDASCSLLAKQALDVAMKSSLDNARMRLQQVCVDMIRAAKGGDKRTVSGYSVPPPAGQQGGGETETKPIPDNLQLLPLYTLAMMKNVAFRGGTDVHPDERVQAHHLLNGLWVTDSKHFVYPRMFSIHDMDGNAGYSVGDDTSIPEDKVAGRDRILLPNVVHLSADTLSSSGIYLLDNGIEMFLWVGQTADMNLISSLFGVQSLDDIDPQQLEVATSGDTFANRFGAITQALSEDLDDPYVIPAKINIVREGDAFMEGRFFWFMIEDRASFQGGTHSYDEFMQFVNNPQASSGSRQAPPGAPVAPPGRPGPPGPGPPGHAGPPGAPPPPGGMGMGGAPPPPQAPSMGGPPGAGQRMGMPPSPGQHMPPPPGQGMQPPPPGQGMPPPPQQGMGAMPPAPGRPMPTPGPPSTPMQNGPPGGPPQMSGFSSGPPRSAPPAMPTPPPQGNKGPPSAPPGPPAPPGGRFSAPPPPRQGPSSGPPPPGGNFSAPPPPRQGPSSGPPAPGAPPQRPAGAMPPPPGRPVATPPPPQQRGMPPPPPRGRMPPPPPRR